MHRSKQPMFFLFQGMLLSLHFSELIWVLLRVLDYLFKSSLARPASAWCAAYQFVCVCSAVTSLFDA